MSAEGFRVILGLRTFKYLYPVPPLPGVAVVQVLCVPPPPLLCRTFGKLCDSKGEADFGICEVGGNTCPALNALFEADGFELTDLFKIGAGGSCEGDECLNKLTVDCSDPFGGMFGACESPCVFGIAKRKVCLAASLRAGANLYCVECELAPGGMSVAVSAATAAAAAFVDVGVVVGACPPLVVENVLLAFIVLAA